MANCGRLALIAAVALTTACGTTEAPDPLAPSGAVGRVRLVNLITDAARTPVNASLEGVAFTAALAYAASAPANLAAPSTAPYAPVLAGPRAFLVKRSADTTVTVANLSFTVEEGQDKSVYAIGGTGGSTVNAFVTTDTNTVAPAGQTRLRIVQLSSTAGSVDVFVTAAGANLATATPVATNLAYQRVSGYFTVPAGTYQVRAVPAGTPAASRAASVSIDLASVAFAGVTGRTIVLADGPTGGTPRRAFALLDR